MFAITTKAKRPKKPVLIAASSVITAARAPDGLALDSSYLRRKLPKNLHNLLITLGTAPLNNSFFRTVVFEQLGERTTARENIKNVNWQGELSLNDWNHFYSKVLNKVGTNKNIRVTVKIETNFTEGISSSRIEEVKSEIHELNLSNEIDLLFDE